MKKIVVWGYWVKNFGDDLFLKSLINKVKEKSNMMIVINTSKKYKKYYEAMGVKVIENDNFIYKIINKISNFFGKPDPFFLRCNKNDYFVMLGGSLFAENKDLNTERRQLLNLRYAINKTKYSFVIGSNFGPYKSEKFYNSYLELFSKVSDVSFRDINSFNLFSSKLENIRYGLDIALEGDWDKNRTTNLLNKDKDIIAISIIDLQNRKELSNYKLQYEKCIAKICNYYIGTGKEIVFLNFCEKEGDREAYESVIQLVDNPARVKLVDYIDIDSINEVIKSCSKIYATRFHAIMMGIYYNKKIVPFVYNEKTENALETYTEKHTSFDIKQLERYNLKDYIDCNQVLQVKRIKNNQLSGLLKSI